MQPQKPWPRKMQKNMQPKNATKYSIPAFFFCIFLFPRVLVVLFELLKTEGPPKKLKNTIRVFAFVCTFFAFVCLHVFCIFLEFLQFFDYFKTGGLSKKAKNARFQNLHAFCIFPESARFFAFLFAFFCTCILWLIFCCIF